MVATTLLRPPPDELLLPVGDVLAFFDAASGDHITTGLRCCLVLRHGGKLLGRSVATASGLHLWPDLAEHWRQPQVPAYADVLVRDDLQRFQPLSLPWPLPGRPMGQIVSTTALGATRVVRVNLHGAPTRRPPPDMASVYGVLAWQADGAPAAWARVRLIDGDGRVHEGASDAEGRFGMHLPRPPVELQVFAEPTMAEVSLGLGAPDVLAFAQQPAAHALADVGGSAAYAPPAFTAGEPLILATQGLPPAHRELRLVPV
ncbi:hypothetical protein ASC95_21010 [Pelomonas sp. Root1217]|uniref:carboxypeptidase regulatory-like domain-containing protein n=1 Tax=Pelomonas sp. Root1217 TaxID=1736430 RepID=UPI000708FB92|nr:carboxypeptidase regulatory-like domain-containing protein [Pelomonas sp. Root1217]KQV48417.1 hypothetical protein ASC95_21010 [Pelomonas sp. Root1217]